MKKAINGVRYDTSSAVEIGRAESRLPATDFHYWAETLYRSPRAGRYFLYGRGGPLTRWGRSLGLRERTGGEGILPLSREDARAWAGAYLEPAVVEAEFGDARR